jgi:hypothetical protein
MAAVVVLAGAAAEEVQGDDEPGDDERHQRPTRHPRARPPLTIARRRRDDRLQLELAEALVAQLVLLDEKLAVEAERVGIGAQERLDVSRAREEVPFLVLERAQVLGTDLRLGLDVRDVEALAHARLVKSGADVGHRDGEE